MRKFIFRTLLFLAPWLLLTAATYLLYQPTRGGDLERMGYLPTATDYHQRMRAAIPPETYYASFRNDSFPDSVRYRYLTIGDSFSRQQRGGYQNFLARTAGPVLHFDGGHPGENPLQTAWALANGSALDSLRVDFLVLQCVERRVTAHARHLDTTQTLTLTEARRYPQEFPYDYYEYEGFVPRHVTNFVKNNLLYRLDERAYHARTYRLTTTRADFFTAEKGNQLLCLYDDVNFVPLNGAPDRIEFLNDLLNRLHRRLEEKGIRLIFLPAPDKFSFYYPYLEHRDSFPRPRFADRIRRISKEYLLLDTEALLRQRTDSQPDIYYYGDTHWSPYGAELVAAGIQEL